MTRAQTVLAFDFGLKRIGIACGDTLTRSAAPRPAATVGAGGPDWQAIGREVRALAPGLMVVGAPDHADGSERFSSLEASAQLAARRASGQRRRRVQRADIDSAAAAVILARWFAGEGE